MTELIQSSSSPVQWIDTEAELQKMALSLSDKRSIAFDTEFDSFNRTYGFTLLLVQVFDGTTVFLIDPLRIRNLRPLWAVMENAKIEKIGYAMGEDVRLMKSHGCNPRNLFDIQVARQLSNRVDAGLANAMREDLGMELDKSSQRSDWAKRPLSSEQLHYLSNDVLHLSRLKGANLMFAPNEELAGIFQEEMKMLEEVEVSEREVKLSKGQLKKYSAECGQALLDLMLLRDQYAEQFNVPTNYIVQMEKLEWIIEHKQEFLQDTFAGGFHPRARGHEAFRKRFVEILEHAPDQCDHVKRERTISREESIALREERLDREERIMREQFLPIESALLAQYGEETVRFLLRGMRKTIIAADFEEDMLRPYQLRLLRTFLKASLQLLVLLLTLIL